MSAILSDAVLVVSVESTSIKPLSRLASALVIRSQRLDKTTVRLQAAWKRLKSGWLKPRTPGMSTLSRSCINHSLLMWWWLLISPYLTHFLLMHNVLTAIYRRHGNGRLNRRIASHHVVHQGEKLPLPSARTCLWMPLHNLVVSVKNGTFLDYCIWPTKPLQKSNCWYNIPSTWYGILEQRQF